MIARIQAALGLCFVFALAVGACITPRGAATATSIVFKNFGCLMDHQDDPPAKAIAICLGETMTDPDVIQAATEILSNAKRASNRAASKAREETLASMPKQCCACADGGR